MRYATLDQVVICEQMRHVKINGSKRKVFTRFTHGTFDGYYSAPARIAGWDVPYRTDAHVLLGMDTKTAGAAIEGDAA